MKTPALALSLLFVSVSLYAQPPAPPECKDLPNGGKLVIDIPGVTTPAACKSCVAGFAIPPNFVLGYSNGHHDTCELKEPDGDNSGYCRADTTCPLGTTRTYQDNTLWVCQSAGTQKTIDCPAPPSAPGTSKPRDPSSPSTMPDARLAACAANAGAAEARLAQKEREIVRLLAHAAPARSIVFASYTAGTQVVNLVIQPLIQILRTRLVSAFREAAASATRQAVACAIGSQSPACVKARADVRSAAAIVRTAADAWSAAVRDIRDQMDALPTTTTAPVKKAVRDIRAEIDTTSGQIAACVADLQRVER